MKFFPKEVQPHDSPDEQNTPCYVSAPADYTIFSISI